MAVYYDWLNSREAAPGDIAVVEETSSVWSAWISFMKSPLESVMVFCIT
jgi:hypothetical protein